MQDSGSSTTEQGLGDVVMEQVNQTGQQVAQQAQNAAGQVVDRATQRAEMVASTQKDQAAQGLDTVAQALRGAAQDSQGMVAQLADQAANQVERFSEYLEHNTVPDMVADAENLIRRSPAVTLGGAVALGMLLSRLIKASPPPPQGYGQQYPSQGSYGGRYANPPGQPRYDAVGQIPPVQRRYAGQEDMQGRRYSGQPASSAQRTVGNTGQSPSGGIVGETGPQDEYATGATSGYPTAGSYTAPDRLNPDTDLAADFGFASQETNDGTLG